MTPATTDPAAPTAPRRSTRPTRRPATASPQALDDTLFVQAGGRLGQDPRPGRPHRPAGRHAARAGLDARRRHHVHREGRGRAARPGAPPPRRRASAGDRPATTWRGRRCARGARRARQRRHRHAAQLRPAAADRAPHRGRAAAPGRGARRGRLGGRLRRPLEPLRRPAPRRSRRRARAAAGHRRRRQPRPPAARSPWPSTRTGTWPSRARPPRPTRSPRGRPTLATLLDEVDAVVRRGRPLLRRRRQARSPSSTALAAVGRAGARCQRRVHPALAPGAHSGRPNARKRGPQGQLARVRPRRPQGAVRRARPPASTTCAGACVHAGGAARWRSTCAGSRSSRPTSAASPASSSSTTCWCWPARCCATPPTGPACGPRCTSATATCSSTSSRTPTPSRSSWRSSSPARATPAGRRRGTTSTPAPATCSSSATPSSRSTGSAGPTSRCSCGRPSASAPATGAWSLTTNFRTGAGGHRRRQRRLRRR